MRLALVVEYEGTKYHGFQYQQNVPTIQEGLEKAIGKFTGEEVRVKGAGRTDAGVHALGQVVTFDTDSNHPLERVTAALNFHLPKDIAVKSTYEVDTEFDPRRHALSRTYVYSVINTPARTPLMRRTSHHVQEPLDIKLMQRSAKLFVGLWDFSRFAATPAKLEVSTVREIFESMITRDRDMITFRIRGSSFLQHQVRRMAGILVETGKGNATSRDIKEMLKGQSSDSVAHSLPPGGLCLQSVQYANFPPRIKY